MRKRNRRAQKYAITDPSVSYLFVFGHTLLSSFSPMARDSLATEKYGSKKVFPSFIFARYYHIEVIDQTITYARFNAR